MSSRTFPKGPAEDNCATDTNFDFGPDGNYGTGTDDGHWSLGGDMLVTTITSSSPNGDLAEPTQKLAKPIVTRIHLVAYDPPVMTVEFEGEKEYWYSCPRGTDANPA